MYTANAFLVYNPRTCLVAANVVQFLLIEIFLNVLYYVTVQPQSLIKFYAIILTVYFGGVY